MRLQEIESKSGFFIDTSGEFMWGEFVIWATAILSIVSWLSFTSAV
jgi:hypothetical protein